MIEAYTACHFNLFGASSGIDFGVHLIVLDTDETYNKFHHIFHKAALGSRNWVPGKQQMKMVLS
jgi:hypothetical protein